MTNLVSGLARAHDVSVITDAQNISPKDLEMLQVNNITLLHLEQRPTFNKLKLLEYLYHFKKAVNKVDPDHIFYATIETSFFGSLITKFRTSRKSYFLITGIGFDFFSSQLRYRLLNLIYLIIFKMNQYKQNTSYLFQNNIDRQLFIKAGFSSQKNSKVTGHFGITLTNFSKTPKEGKMEFFYVGKFVKSKGILELLEATKYLEKKYSNFRVIIAGPNSTEASDSLTPKERKSIDDSSFIDYLGFVDYEDMSSLYQKFDIFVLPSYREGLSSSALEAAGNGMPLIVTDGPGLTECINNNGYLVQPRDSIGLAKAMERFIKDPALILDFSKNSREHIRINYSIEKMVAVYLDLIETDVVI